MLGIILTVFSHKRKFYIYPEFTIFPNLKNYRIFAGLISNSDTSALIEIDNLGRPEISLMINDPCSRFDSVRVQGSTKGRPFERIQFWSTLQKPDSNNSIMATTSTIHQASVIYKNGCSKALSIAVVLPILGKTPNAPKILKHTDRLILETDVLNPKVQWFYNYDSIETYDSTFLPLQGAGLYQARVNANGCWSDTSKMFEVLIISGINNDSRNWVSLTNNPVSIHDPYMSIISNLNAEFMITSLVGETLLKGNLYSKDINRIDLSDIDSGLYVLTLLSNTNGESEEKTFKIIIQ